MSDTKVYYDSVPEIMTDAVLHRRVLAAAVNRNTQGKLNVTLDVTLSAASTTTTITDARIGIGSVLLLSPKSAKWAQNLSNIWVSSTGSGKAVLSHPSNLGADCVYRLAILG